MKRSFAAVAFSVAASLAVVSPAQADDYEWRLKPGRDAGKVHFTIEATRPGHRWTSSSDVALSQFRGLPQNALTSGGPAKFELVRDAGRLVCDGHFNGGRGIGSFQFVPNPQYAAELQRLGYEAPNEKELFSMAMSEVSLDFARGVKNAGVPSTTRELLEMRIHGLSLDYIERMRGAGYTTLSAKDFVELKIHGVTPDLVAELKSAGYDLPAKKVVELKIHGVSPTYIRELSDYGLRPTASQIVEMRIHGVTGEYLKKLRDSGFKNLTPEKIVKLKIHGID